MTTFNWRVLSENTVRSYEQAAKDFELVTGCPIQHADVESAEAWRASMIGRGLSVSTIRSRLIALKVISGVKVLLPKRQPVVPVTLSAEQVRKVMSIVAYPADRMLLVRLLTLGLKARTVTMPAETFMAHFTGTNECELSSQRTTRKLRRYARQAGLNEKQVSLRVWCLSGRKLLETLGPAELTSLLDHSPNRSAQPVEWKPLHGIGRRSVKA
jgi:hypothetical protein